MRSQVAEAADVIIEVIDARDPEGGRCRDVERFVRSKGANKKVVLLLNKIGKARGDCDDCRGFVDDCDAI